jgi:superfamily II DNA or RNA helicase
MDKNQVQKSIVESLPNLSHGIVLLAPRIGKTKIGIDILKKEKSKSVLWVTPNAELRDVDIPKEFKLWKATTIFKKTTIICYASLSDHKGNYDKIILDEVQDLTPANSQPLFNGNIKFNTVLGLTGTLPKHNEKQELYAKLRLKVLVNMNIDEAVDKGLIAPYNIKVVQTRLDKNNKYLKAGSKEKPFMQTEDAMYSYLTKIINAKMFSGQPVPQFFYLNRMRFIYNLKSKNDFAKRFVSKLAGRTLVFTGGIEQAENICKHTYHSKTDDKDLQDFQNGKIDKLACVNAGGVGFTYRNVDNFVIVQVNSNNKGDSTQKIARSLVLQEGYVANIYIICVIDTVDEKWVTKVLENFDKSRVQYVDSKNY